MRAGGGKDKGSGFERKICKELSLWVSEGENESLFWRSAMSGGRSTVMFKKGQENAVQAGDISAIDIMGHRLIDKFVIECKCYKSLKLDSLIYGVPKDGSILEFWNVITDEADRNVKEPMLIGKENNKPIILGLSLAGVRMFAGGDGDNYILQDSISQYKSRDLFLFIFKDFLENIDPACLDLL